MRAQNKKDGDGLAEALEGFVDGDDSEDGAGSANNNGQTIDELEDAFAEEAFGVPVSSGRVEGGE